VAAWEAHLQELRQRAGYLNARAFDEIHFRGPGTDLTIGLPACALWEAAAFTSESGIEYVANLPTEEVFTLPHRHRVDGTIHASRAISYAGNLIDDFTLVFEKGRVVNAVAKKGEETLKSLLATDENSSRLGEVGLVPDSSPVSRSHALFYMSLIDENAACHLALGNARRFSMKDGTRMTAGQFKAAGGNQSSVHVDFMIGSGEMDVDGITHEKAVVPLMRQGEWAITI
jgi:aminopeptidase